MSRGFSLYLDTARVIAALAVLVSHFGYAFVTAHGLGWARDYNIGSDAVIIFFVLSGLVIAHTVEVKDASLRSYAFARLTRLWSVAVPAIVLSVLLCVIGWTLAPALYGQFSVADVIGGAARSATFTNGLWFSAAHPPANNPYWSVAYEFWYYVAFGAAVFLTGRARVYSLAAIVLVVGPSIVLLAPCWLLGVWVRRQIGAGALTSMKRARAGMLTIAPALIYGVCQVVHLPAVLTEVTTAALGGRDPNLILGFADEFAWNWIVAALTAVHFLGAASLARWMQPSPALGGRAVRWIAARTFSLYLFHMPVLQLVTAAPGYDPANPFHALLLAALIFAVSFGLAEVTERRLGRFRRALTPLIFHRKHAVPAAS